MWRWLALVLVGCASAADAVQREPLSTDSGQPEQLDGGVPSEAAHYEAPAPPPECTYFSTTSQDPVDCAVTHGLWWCAGKGDNGCVPCPYDSVDGGIRRRLDCNQNAVDGCEVPEGDQDCGACGNACAGGQHCVTFWSAAPQTFSPHCE